MERVYTKCKFCGLQNIHIKGEYDIVLDNINTEIVIGEFMNFEIKVLDQFVYEEGSKQEKDCWDKLKSAIF